MQLPATQPPPPGPRLHFQRKHRLVCPFNALYIKRIRCEGGARTAVLHELQCFTSVVKSVHIPPQQAGSKPVHSAAVQDPQCCKLVDRSVHCPEQQPGCVPPHGKAEQELQWLASELRSIHVPEQQAGLIPVHGLAEQDPQWSIVARSVQAPEQHAGLEPRHGRAVQLPQWAGSLLISVHTPLQQVGWVPVHLLPHRPQLFGSVAVLVQVQEQQVG